MNYITEPHNMSRNHLRPYTKVVWKNCWHSTKEMVLIPPRFTMIIIIFQNDGSIFEKPDSTVKMNYAAAQEHVPQAE